MGQKLGTRPSTLLHVTDPWVAFCVDRALYTFASGIESDMDDAEARLPKNAKDSAHIRARQRVLDQYLGVDPSEQSDRFRSIG